MEQQVSSNLKDLVQHSVHSLLLLPWMWRKHSTGCICRSVCVWRQRASNRTRRKRDSEVQRSGTSFDAMILEKRSSCNGNWWEENSTDCSSNNSLNWSCSRREKRCVERDADKVETCSLALWSQLWMNSDNPRDRWDFDFRGINLMDVGKQDDSVLMNWFSNYSTNNNVMNPQKLMLDYVVVVLCWLRRWWDDVIELHQRMNWYEARVRLTNSLVTRISRLFSLMWVSLEFECGASRNLLCTTTELKVLHQRLDQQAIARKKRSDWNSSVTKEQARELTSHVEEYLWLLHDDEHQVLNKLNERKST